MTWPVCSRTNSAVARRSRGDTEVGGHLGRVYPVRAAGEDEDRAAAAVENQAVGDGADLATEGRRGQRGGVHGFGQDDDSPGAAGGDPGGAEPRDGWVLEGLRHVRDLTIWHRPGAKS